MRHLLGRFEVADVARKVAAYLGQGDAFDRSMLDFAVRYADQNERDYAEFAAAVRSGQLPAAEGI